MSKKWMALLAALMTAGPAVADSSSTESDWSYTATLYGWFPGVSTTVETPQGEIEAEVDFDEVLETLDIAFLGALEARKGRWSLIGDFQYFDIGADFATPTGALFSGGEVDSKMALFSAYATYAVVQNSDTRFDVGGGLRYYDVTVETQLISQGTAPTLLLEDDGSWTDLLLAARVKHHFNARWSGIAYGDLGGFGLDDASELSWRAFAGAGYQFNERWSAVGGYQYLSIDRDFERTNITSEIAGPFLGVQIAF